LADPTPIRHGQRDLNPRGERDGESGQPEFDPSLKAQQFSATVTNTGHTAVTWSISPVVRQCITTARLYTAPASITSSQTVTVKATALPIPIDPATATVALNPPVSVTVSPASLNLTQSQAQQFPRP